MPLVRPADLAAHRVTRDRKARLELVRIVQAVDDDSMTVADARELVAAIRTHQQAQAA
jgi:hypothetical protein